MSTRKETRRHNVESADSGSPAHHIVRGKRSSVARDYGSMRRPPTSTSQIAPAPYPDAETLQNGKPPPGPRSDATRAFADHPRLDAGMQLDPFGGVIPRYTPDTARAAPVPYQNRMERLFGQSFDDVAAHLGQDQLAAQGIRGAAAGNTVAFANANPDPALVAHELTHVVQQRRAGTTTVAAKSTISQPSDAAEQEADAVAERVRTCGFEGPQIRVSAAPSAVVQLDRGADSNMSLRPQPPKLSIVPRDQDLGSVHIGKRQKFWVTLVNDSDKPVAFNQLGDAISGQVLSPLQQLSGGPGLIAPGDHLGIQLAFQPTRPGAFSETLSAFDHDGAVLGQMNVRAQVNRPGKLEAKNKNVDFQLAVVNRPAMSSSRAVTVKNVGDEPIELGSVHSEGKDADQFRVAQLAPIVLAPGHQATVQVEFAPTARGHKSAAIRFAGTPITDGQPSRTLTSVSVKGHAVVDASSKKGDSVPELITDLSNKKSTAETPAERRAELRRLAETNACKGKESADCFLTDYGHLRLMQMLYQRLDNAAENFAHAVTEEKLADRLRPADTSAWVMAIETFYVLASISTGRLATGMAAAMRKATGSAKGWAGIGEVARHAKDLQLTEAGLKFAFSSATRSARGYAKERVRQKVTGASSLQAFLEGLRREMNLQRQNIADNLGGLTHKQLLALTAYYDVQNHPSSLYQQRLRSLVAAYDRNVVQAGRPGSAAILVIGPNGQQRRAMFLDGGMHDKKRIYRFGRWIEQGFEEMASRPPIAPAKYEKVGGATVSAVVPKHAGFRGLHRIKHDDDRLVDPKGEVARWAVESSCVFAPKRLNSDVPGGLLCGNDRLHPVDYSGDGTKAPENK